MAKNLTPLQQEFQKEISRIKRAVSRYEKKYGITSNVEIPSMESLGWKKLTKERIETLRYEYRPKKIEREVLGIPEREMSEVVQDYLEQQRIKQEQKTSVLDERLLDMGVEEIEERSILDNYPTIDWLNDQLYGLKDKGKFLFPNVPVKLDFSNEKARILEQWKNLLTNAIETNTLDELEDRLKGVKGNLEQDINDINYNEYADYNEENAGMEPAYADLEFFVSGDYMTVEKAVEQKVDTGEHLSSTDYNMVEDGDIQVGTNEEQIEKYKKMYDNGQADDSFYALEDILGYEDALEVFIQEMTKQGQ